MSASEFELMFDGLMRGLRAYGVLSGGAVREEAARGIHLDVSGENQYVAPVAGVIAHKVKLHEFVEAGQVVAVMHSVDGTHGVRDVISHRPGYVLRQSTFGFVEQGALVGNTGTPRP